jgi:acetylornithine/succinyldiaminopimelate/putrescine aminotransferase
MCYLLLTVQTGITRTGRLLAGGIVLVQMDVK